MLITPVKLFRIMDDTKFLHFYALGILGLIIKNAQGISRGTLFKNYHTHPSYNESQRKRLYPTKPGSPPWLPDYLLLTWTNYWTPNKWSFTLQHMNVNVRI